MQFAVGRAGLVELTFQVVELNFHLVELLEDAAPARRQRQDCTTASASSRWVNCDLLNNNCFRVTLSQFIVLDNKCSDCPELLKDFCRKT